jgi:hypothetical protein
MDPVSIPSLSAEQEELFRLIEDTREHVFVTGRAGTGKSTLLQHLAWNTEKQIAVCAPTGVAALNVEGRRSTPSSGCRSDSSPTASSSSPSPRVACSSDRHPRDR